MTKADFVDLLIEAVKSKGYMKTARIPRHSFYIADEAGNKAEFAVKTQSQLVHYSKEDARIMVDTFIEVMTEILRNGGFVEFRGFGTFGLKWRAPRRTKVPGTNKWVRIEGHYVPSFEFGNVLRNAVRVYDALEKDELEDRRAKYSEVSAMFNTGEDDDDENDDIKEGYGFEDDEEEFDGIEVEQVGGILDDDDDGDE